MSGPDRASLFDVHAHIARTFRTLPEATRVPDAGRAAPAPLVAEKSAPTEIEVDAATQRLIDRFKKQRDEARVQRERARLQRDDAREQRDMLRGQIERLNFELEATLARGGKQVAMSQPTAMLTDVDFFAQEIERQAQVKPLLDKQQMGMNLSVKEHEVLADRLAPMLHRTKVDRRTPGADVAFLTVGNDKFVPGLQAMLRSLIDVYPDFQSDIYIYNDGTLSDFVQRQLCRIYPNLHFCVPDMAWFEDVPKKSDNHKRIGKLGYMNIYGLALEGYSRVILLDSDLLILDDISALWKGDDFIVCHDAGDREYAVRSEYTGDYVLNSGVISIPGRYTGQAVFEEIKELVRFSAARELCPIIDRFADQKAWNIFLRDKPKVYAPGNYNCNIKYLVKTLGGRLEGVSIVHFAGPKPWNNKNYIHNDLVTPNVSKATQYPKLWTDHVDRLTYERRLAEYRQWATASRRTAPVKPDSVFQDRKLCVLIGNGPSIEQTNLELIADYERFVFNWFLLHPRFDEIKPDHLVLASHMFFGGWNTQQPSFPEGYLTKLRNARHRPVIWTSFSYRELFEIEGLDKEFEVNYFLFEKPFKRFVDKVGRYVCDIDGFLDDARTGVLSAALPAAIGMGFETVLLVGCDSNYNQPDVKSKYFYDAAEHKSQETNQNSLTATWTEEGRGQYVYKLVAESMRARGVEFFDCTVNGAIKFVDKRPLEEYAKSKF